MFHGHTGTQVRRFVSEGFQLKEAWQSRLAAPIFQNLDFNRYYFEVERKFQRENRGSPIDADIFANAVLLPKQSGKPLTEINIRDRLDQLEDILQRFRRTPQTNMALDSMAHAVVRAYLDSNNTISLLRILNKKQEFGLFPDDYALILMLDFFIQSNNFRDASKVAVDCMLQEEYGAPIVSQAAVYSVFKYVTLLPELDHDQEWHPLLPNETATEAKRRRRRRGQGQGLV